MRMTRVSLGQAMNAHGSSGVEEVEGAGEVGLGVETVVDIVLIFRTLPPKSL